MASPLVHVHELEFVVLEHGFMGTHEDLEHVEAAIYDAAAKDEASGVRREHRRQAKRHRGQQQQRWRSDEPANQEIHNDLAASPMNTDPAADAAHSCKRDVVVLNHDGNDKLNWLTGGISACGARLTAFVLSRVEEEVTKRRIQLERGSGSSTRMTVPEGNPQALHHAPPPASASGLCTAVPCDPAQLDPYRYAHDNDTCAAVHSFPTSIAAQPTSALGVPSWSSGTLSQPTQREGRVLWRLVFHVLGYSLGGLVVRAALPDLMEEMERRFPSQGGGGGGTGTSGRSFASSSPGPTQAPCALGAAAPSASGSPSLRLHHQFELHWDTMVSLCVPHAGTSASHPQGTMAHCIADCLDRVLLLPRLAREMMLKDPYIEDALTRPRHLTALKRFTKKLFVALTNDRMVWNYSAAFVLPPVERRLLDGWRPREPHFNEAILAAGKQGKGSAAGQHRCAFPGSPGVEDDGMDPEVSVSVEVDGGPTPLTATTPLSPGFPTAAPLPRPATSCGGCNPLPWLLYDPEEVSMWEANMNFFSRLQTRPATSVAELRRNGVLVAQHKAPCSPPLRRVAGSSAVYSSDVYLLEASGTAADVFDDLPHTAHEARSTTDGSWMPTRRGTATSSTATRASRDEAVEPTAPPPPNPLGLDGEQAEPLDQRMPRVENWITEDTWPSHLLPREREIALTFLEGVGPIELHLVDLNCMVLRHVDEYVALCGDEAPADEALIRRLLQVSWRRCHQLVLHKGTYDREEKEDRRQAKAALLDSKSSCTDRPAYLRSVLKRAKASPFFFVVEYTAARIVQQRSTTHHDPHRRQRGSRLGAPFKDRAAAPGTRPPPPTPQLPTHMSAGEKEEDVRADAARTTGRTRDGEVAGQDALPTRPGSEARNSTRSAEEPLPPGPGPYPPPLRPSEASVGEVALPLYKASPQPSAVGLAGIQQQQQQLMHQDSSSLSSHRVGSVRSDQLLAAGAGGGAESQPQHTPPRATHLQLASGGRHRRSPCGTPRQRGGNHVREGEAKDGPGESAAITTLSASLDHRLSDAPSALCGEGSPRVVPPPSRLVSVALAEPGTERILLGSLQEIDSEEIRLVEDSFVLPSAAVSRRSSANSSIPHDSHTSHHSQSGLPLHSGTLLYHYPGLACGGQQLGGAIVTSVASCCGSPKGGVSRSTMASSSNLSTTMLNVPIAGRPSSRMSGFGADSSNLLGGGGGLHVQAVGTASGSEDGFASALLSQQQTAHGAAMGLGGGNTASSPVVGLHTGGETDQSRSRPHSPLAAEADAFCRASVRIAGVGQRTPSPAQPQPRCSYCLERSAVHMAPLRPLHTPGSTSAAEGHAGKPAEVEVEMKNERAAAVAHPDSFSLPHRTQPPPPPLVPLGEAEGRGGLRGLAGAIAVESAALLPRESKRDDDQCVQDDDGGGLRGETGSDQMSRRPLHGSSSRLLAAPEGPSPFPRHAHGGQRLSSEGSYWDVTHLHSVERCGPATSCTPVSQRSRQKSRSRRGSKKKTILSKRNPLLAHRGMQWRPPPQGGSSGGDLDPDSSSYPAPEGAAGYEEQGNDGHKEERSGTGGESQQQGL